MNSTIQRNGLYLEDPLEKLRGFFRMYWQFISRTELKQAQDLWDKNIAAELESIYQSHPDISRERIQAVLFEEKQRLQDHAFLVESIVEKLIDYLNQKPLHANEHTAYRAPAPAKTTNRNEENSTAKASSATKTSGASFGTHGLDLTSMIDSMIEDEKLLNR